MLNRTEIAARVGAAQYDLANGRNQLQVEKELIELRKEIVAGGLETEAHPRIEEDVLAGFRADAVDQLVRLRELLTEADLQSVPDMELFHLSCCAEMAHGKVFHYFFKRNGQASSRVKEETSCQG